MDKDFIKSCVKDATSVSSLAEKICGYGWFDHAGESFPVRREYIEEYIEIGMMFERERQKKEKLCMTHKK